MVVSYIYMCVYVYTWLVMIYREQGNSTLLVLHPRTNIQLVLVLIWFFLVWYIFVSFIQIISRFRSHSVRSFGLFRSQPVWFHPFRSLLVWTSLFLFELIFFGLIWWYSASFVPFRSNTIIFGLFRSFSV